jgi:hypothetical protein
MTNENGLVSREGAKTFLATKGHRERRDQAKEMWLEIRNVYSSVRCSLRSFVAKSDSCLPGFLLKNNRSGFKKETMNPGRGVMKSG